MSRYAAGITPEYDEERRERRNWELWAEIQERRSVGQWLNPPPAVRVEQYRTLRAAYHARAWK